MLDEKFSKIICCPNCQGNLNEEKEKLICTKCKKEYIIKDNIPVLLIDYIEKLRSDL